MYVYLKKLNENMHFYTENEKTNNNNANNNSHNPGKSHYGISNFNTSQELTQNNHLCDRQQSVVINQEA